MSKTTKNNQPGAKEATKIMRKVGDGIEIYVTGKYGTQRAELLSTATASKIEKITKEMVRGVTYGYKEKITIRGVGYRAQQVGNNLELSLGYRNPVQVQIPSTIELKVKGGGTIIEGWSTSYRALRQYLSTIVEIKPASKDKYNSKGLEKWK